MEAQSKTITRELNIQVRALTPELIQNRQAEFVISTEAVDTYNTVFRASGWDFTRYNQNPVVLYGHRSNSGDPDDVIGTSEVFTEGTTTIARVTFEEAETNPKAEKIFRKVQAGTLRMASIGADVQEYHFGKYDEGENPDVLYFDRQTLLEWSIVPIGSNPEALKREAQSIEEIKASITRNINVTDAQTIQSKNEQEQTTVRKAQCLIYNY